MSRRTGLVCAAIIAVCFLYTGSVYMSQSFRLMGFYPEQKVDVITSVYFYLLQAAGLGIFSLGLYKRPRLFRSKTLFAALLLTGAGIMAWSQMTNSATALEVAGYLFNLHIGLYFGFYIALLGRTVPPRRSGLCFGAAYAFASVGTYALSLVRGGDFMVSREITVIYLLLAALTVGLVHCTQDAPDCPAAFALPRGVGYLVATVAVMVVIFSVGSGLYYSYPAAQTVNWSLIRAFYAIGLILAGVILDRKPLVGEILVLASLTYPLIMSALISDGVTSTTALSFSYIFRGFLTIYYIVAFTKYGFDRPELLPLAPVGLLISRASEALVSLVLLSAPIPGIYQMIFSAACFLPLLGLVFLLHNKPQPEPPVSEAKRFALFSEKYALTSREMEVLRCLARNMSDGEIAAELSISKNTVRFHVSRLLKKTAATSRIEVVHLLNKF